MYVNHLNSVEIVFFAALVIDDCGKVISNVLFLLVTVRIRIERWPEIKEEI